MQGRCQEVEEVSEISDKRPTAGDEITSGSRTGSASQDSQIRISPDAGLRQSPPAEG